MYNGKVLDKPSQCFADVPISLELKSSMYLMKGKLSEGTEMPLQLVANALVPTPLFCLSVIEKRTLLRVNGNSHAEFLF